MTVLLLIACVTLSLCMLASPPFWIANFLVFGCPLAYLYAVEPATVRSIDLRFVAKASLFCIVFYDYVGLRYEGWTGPTSFPPLPGGVPIEHLQWCVLAIFLTITLNNRFFETLSRATPVRWTRSVVYGLFFFGLAIAVIPALNSPFQEYGYLKIGLLIYPPLLALVLVVDRPILRQLLLAGLVFTTLNLIYELIAVRNGYWGFEGQYVSWVSLLGQRFPVEELIFIVILTSPAILAVNALRLNWKQASVTRPAWAPSDTD